MRDDVDQGIAVRSRMSCPSIVVRALALLSSNICPNSKTCSRGSNRRSKSDQEFALVIADNLRTSAIATCSDFQTTGGQ